MTSMMMTAVPAAPACFDPDEIELLDLETYEVPRRLSERDRLNHTGGQGRRQPRTELEQDDEQ